MARDDHRQGSRGRDEARRNPLEIAVLTASALLVAASVGVLAWQGVRDERPPTLEARVDSVVVRGGAHHVHVTITNAGDRAAAHAELRGRLLDGGTVVAESEATLDWVPGRSSTAATLLFAADPRAHELEARIVGFAEP